MRRPRVEQKRANIGRFIISIMVAFLLQWMIHEANRQTSGGSILFHNFFLAVMQNLTKSFMVFSSFINWDDCKIYITISTFMSVRPCVCVIVTLYNFFMFEILGASSDHCYSKDIPGKPGFLVKRQSMEEL